VFVYYFALIFLARLCTEAMLVTRRVLLPSINVIKKSESRATLARIYIIVIQTLAHLSICDKF
jgi:hypothetical protein